MKPTKAKKRSRRKSQNRYFKEFEEAFQLVDIDGDGLITIHELMSLFKKLGKQVPKSEVKRIFKELDKNNSGTIDWDEFLIAAALPDQPDETSLRAAFDIYDTNKDGFICANELKSTMNKLGDYVDDDEVSMLISRVDEDGDGLISFSEFKQLMKKESI